MRLTRRQMLQMSAGALGAFALSPRLAASDSVTGAKRGSSPLHPPLGRILYHVRRDGSVIGEHVAEFVREGDAFVVRNDVELVVRFFGIPVYRYEHQNEEVWRDGLLQAVTASTNKDGRKFDCTVERRDGLLHVSGRKGDFSVDGKGLTTSLWHPETPKAARLLDIEDGKMRSISGTLIGDEMVPVGDNRESSHHYRITGDMTRDIWYGAAGRLLRVGFDTKQDGSRITLEPYRIEA